MKIYGRTTIQLSEWKCNVDVIFHIPMQRLEIIVPLTSEKSFAAVDYVFFKNIKELVIVNEEGQKFTAYDCVCYRKVINIDKITMSGQYKTLIKGSTIPKAGVLYFHFEGLEHYFEKSEFINSEQLLKENEWSLINNEGSKEIAAKISGTENIESLIIPLLRVREYFEFLIASEIYIDKVVYSNKATETIEILNDKFLISKNECFFDETSTQSPEVIEKGINQWLSHYESYKEVFKIWRKTIYNRQVSDEDVFIWRCQSFELLCTLCQPLFDDAKQLIKTPKRQQFPNLSNFLGALNAKCHFINCDDSYFDKVTDVRNVYIHYNPNKHITDREWHNSTHLIDMALKVAIRYAMGLDITDIGFFILMPEGSGENIRR